MVLLKLSPTKAATWLDCPRRYYYSYVAKSPRGRRWAHLSYGNAVHGALKKWFDRPAEERSLDCVPELVEQAWVDDGFRDVGQAATWKQRATDIVRAYVTDLDPSFEPLSCERTLAFKTDTFIMEGRIDRLDDRGESVAVVDYKTGKAPPTIDEVRGSAALAMYAAMVERTLRRPVSSVALHHLPSGEDVAWEPTPDSIATQVWRMGSLAQDILVAQDTWEAGEGHVDEDQVLNSIFPTTPSPVCGFCDYWDRCAAGQARTPRRESWEGLEPESG